MSWWRRRSLRFRLTALATAVLAVGLGLGALLFVHVVANSLTGGVDRAARDRAREVAASYDVSELQRQPGGRPQALAQRGDGLLVQVVTDAGQVVAASPGAAALPPLQVGPVAVGGEPLRAVAVGLPGGRVVVASPVRTVTAGVHIVVVALLVGVPLLAGLVAAGCWLLIGSALRPVEQLRRTAAGVTPGQGPVRLSVPGSSDELARLATTLDDMLARLDRASVRQRRFVADAAHELRSPLAAARIELEVALQVGGDWQAVGADVLVEVLRLGRLVEDLLELARVDDSGVTRRTGRLDLATLARDAVRRSGPRRVPVGVVADEVGPTVQADPDALARVLRNLLDNAVRHAAARVVLTVRRRGEHAELLVRDDGPGVPAAQRDLVFDRFARLDDGRARDEGGTGLGLPIARELARAEGGDVVLLPTGPGATFVVRLPLAPG